MVQVSVVIPAYNAERTIEFAVKSALAQVGVDLEVIVCDDFSSDSTLKVLSEINDRRLHILRNRENIGPGPSRDRAIAHATAPWIAMIDADDAWEAGRIEKLLRVVGKENEVMPFDDLLNCHDVKGRMRPWRRLHGNRAFGGWGRSCREVRLEDYIRSERLLIKPLIPIHLIRENQIRHERRRFAEDAEFFIRVALAGAKMRYLPEPLYLYRITPGSATSAAHDPSLMRQCLEDCILINGVPETVREALAEKIRSLRVNESVYDLVARAKCRDYSGIVRLLRAQPSLLRVAPRRMFRHLLYQLHRMSHGGHSR